jgi:type III secretory pathway component EscS
MDTTTQTLIFFICLTLGGIAVATAIGLVVAQSLDAEYPKRRSID